MGNIVHHASAEAVPTPGKEKDIRQRETVLVGALDRRAGRGRTLCESTHKGATLGERLLARAKQEVADTGESDTAKRVQQIRRDIATGNK